MAEIINLKEYNENKQKENYNSRISYLEDILKKIEHYKKAGKDYKNLEIALDGLFSVEYQIGKNKCKKISNSKGFFYILKTYGTSDLCMDYFAKKYAKTILYDEVEEDLEEIVHNNFNTKEEFINAKPVSYIVDLISNEDKMLANYICIDTNTSDFFSEDLSIIYNNWNCYSEMSECKRYNRMLNRLKKYFEAHKMETSFTSSEIIIYLAKKNNILDTLAKYYIFEDDDIYELADSNDLEDKLNNGKVIPMSDLNLIKNMNLIMKKSLGLNKIQKIK